jgi:hypothetical protein
MFMKNKRKYMRLQSAINANCFSHNGERVNDDVRIIDISREGVHLITNDTAMNKGDRVSLEVPLPKNEKHATFAGEVTWAVFGNGTCHAGVFFKAIDPSSRFKLLDHAYSEISDN